ncbi:MAG TPA: hypothetical protein VMF33_01420 [Acidimicrobiales bacterium]|nr:hypothetical protein [Acidimicrobiales bacterium]
MRLDVYRSCTWREKRQVLEAFWSSRVESTGRIHEAAVQYGPYAVACLAIVAVELVVVFVAALSRGVLVGWVALAVEVIVVPSLWWAIMRSRALKQPVA